VTKQGSCRNSSDAQIRKAVAPRALPVYSQEELEIRDALTEEGARQLLSRRAGGRSNSQGVRAGVRRQLITELYRDLSPCLKRTPTGARTITRITEILAVKYGWNVSSDTVLKDVKEIGTACLRGL
jgi:hypothetical protein